RGSKADLRQMLRKAVLPPLAMDVGGIELMKGQSVSKRRQIVKSLAEVCQGESVGSFVSENCGGLAVRICSGTPGGGLEVRGMTIPAGGLLNGAKGARFVRCYFQPTGVRGHGLIGSECDDCEFEQLDLIEPEALVDARFLDCRVRAVTS